MLAQHSPVCPLPISTTQFARHLLRLHARLRGELAKARDGAPLLVNVETSEKVMTYIEGLLEFLGVQFEPASLNPVRTHSRVTLLAPTAIQLARQLLRLHIRVRGELAKAHDGAPLLVSVQTSEMVMGYVEGLLLFLGVQFEPASLRPVRSWPKVGPLPRGGLRRGILATLKADGGWMTIRAIADAVVARHRLALSAAQAAHFLQKLREAAHALFQAGFLERESDLKLGFTGAIQRWHLSRTRFRPR